VIESELLRELVEHRNELELSWQAYRQFERALEELRRYSPDHSLIREGLKTIRNVLEGALGSTVATALWPTITNSWLPAIVNALASLSR
jgi:hypothetical protein